MNDKVTRFEELKARGWTALTGDERKEYTDLKAELSGGDTLQGPVLSKEALGVAKNLSNPAKEEKLITITQEQLEALMENKLAALRAELTSPARKESPNASLGGEWKPLTAHKERNRIATIRQYRADSNDSWKYILNWRHHKYEINEETGRKDKAIYKVTVIDPTTKEESTVYIPLIELVNVELFPYVTVEIISTVKKPKYKSQGITQLPSRDKGGYAIAKAVGNATTPFNDSGETIEMIVTAEDIISTIRTKEGVEFEVNADRLNQ